MLTARAGLLLVVGAALIDGAGRVLVQQRPADKQHGGLWEFPGGKVEAGETPAVALIRELDEELGIGVTAKSLIPAGFAVGTEILLLLYACRRWSGTPAATDGAELAWVTAAELAGLPMPPADVPLVAVVSGLLAG